MTAARHVRIIGRVQGVFFRGWTKQAAEQLGVRGWVCNRTDGTVEAHLEGEDDRVEELVQRMRAGPPSAKVEGLSCEETEVQNLASFELRH